MARRPPAHCRHVPGILVGLGLVTLLLGGGVLARVNATRAGNLRFPSHRGTAIPRSAALTELQRSALFAQDPTETPADYPGPPTMAATRPPTEVYVLPEQPSPTETLPEPAATEVSPELTPTGAPEATSEPPPAEVPTEIPTLTPTAAPTPEPPRSPTETTTRPPYPSPVAGEEPTRAPSMSIPTITPYPALYPPANTDDVQPLIHPSLFLALAGLLAAFTVWLAARLIRSG